MSVKLFLPPFFQEELIILYSILFTSDASCAPLQIFFALPLIPATLE